MKQTPPAIIVHKDGSVCKQYIRHKHLGVGGFATVYSVESVDSKRIYACKVIDKTLLKRKEHRVKLVSEIKLHSSLEHKNVVQLEKYFDDLKFVYIMLELCTGGSLMDLLRTRRRLSEPEVRYLMYQVVVGIEYLHKECVLHRDLKLGNILLDADLNIKLCDFGLAAEMKGRPKTTICGTPNYIAPEILNQRKWHCGHSYEVDIWSLGVIMFTLLTGKPPFETQRVEETYRRINKVSYQWPTNVAVSSAATDLVTKILNIDPKMRPNLAAIKRHAFFQGAMPERLPNCILTRKPRHHELFPLRQQQQEECKAQSTNTSCTNSNDSSSVLAPTATKPKYPTTTATKATEPVYVVRHVDFTKRYGIGYILSNGYTGASFNDATHVLLHGDQATATYVNEDDEMECCSLRDYPERLAKKMKLLAHFNRHLWRQNDENDDAIRVIKSTMANLPHMSTNPGADDRVVHVRLWLKEKYAILFRLTNRVVQVHFHDRSSLLLKGSQHVVYRDKIGTMETFTMSQLHASNRRDLIKRFQYTQQAIKKLRTN